MSAFPNHPPWGNTNNGSLNNQSNNLPVGLHGGHQVNRPPYQNSWQQQQQIPPQQQMAQQPMYPPQHQTYWNNNINQKPPPMNTSQFNFNSDRSSPWAQNPPSQYAPQQPPPHQQYQQHQVEYNNPANTYPYGNYQQNISSQQQGYTQQNISSSDQFGGDAWNWGWEESGNSNTSAPYPTNNNVQNDPTWDWNVDDSTPPDFQATNPVQNYFQPANNQVAKEPKLEQFQNDINAEPTPVPAEPQNYFGNLEQPNQCEDNSSKVLDKTETKALTVENVAEVNFQSGDDTVFDVKSESAHSYQSGSLSNTSEFKNERLSPDPNKIPLTTQALREFHKEIYENGPVNFKSRHNADGLTPQWSIESQMSQDTISDDISPSIQGGSQSDIDTRPSTVSQSPSSNQHADPSWYEYRDNANDSRIEENLSNLRSPQSALEQDTKRVPPPQHSVAVSNDVYDEVSSNLESLSISNRSSNTDDVENKEIVSPEQRGSLSKAKITPPPISRPGEGSSSNNPYSASASLSRKSATKRVDPLINPPSFQSPVVENENYVNQPNSTVIQESLNQQVLSLSNQGNLGWYNKNVGLTDESVNLETVPDNKERPDAVEHEIRQITSNPVNPRVGSRPIQPYSNVSFDNYELSPRVNQDRNQYLETGQLGDQGEVAASEDVPEESLPPPGLSRLVTGERQHSLNSNAENSAGDVSTPPPGLDRMVLGQMTEIDNSTIPDVISFNHHLHQNTPPPGLHRMVLGQLTDDHNTNSTEDNQNNSASNMARDDIPPPGLHRMIPGESSSPETQNTIQLSIDTLPREQRVVTGVARDEIDVNPLQTDIPSASPTPANRLSSQPTSSEESRLQFQSERCETIGSDNVDNFTTSQVDNSSNKQNKRKDKDRDRERDRDRLPEDVSSDERERELSSRRRDRDSDYYRDRDRNRDREDLPSGDQPPRYRDDKGRRSKTDRVDRDQDRRKYSPGRYREEKDRRREYRDDRRRPRDSDYSDDEDADINGYYSDRDRRNMSGYREDFDKSYSRRDDRARSLRPEKSPRDGIDDRTILNSVFKPSTPNSEENKKSQKRVSWPPILACTFPLNRRSPGRDKRRGYSDRDRERDRDRDRGRDRDRDHRTSDYYRRKGHEDVDDYRDNQRSRPSSRNGSVHDYKPRTLSNRDYGGDRDRDRDHYRTHSKRDMYYQQGYNHDPAYYNYYMQYYENLRRTNPEAYADLCKKYYAQSQHGTFDGTYTEDRGSVHSGRSSANEENKDRYMKNDQAHPCVPPHHLYPCYQPLVTDQPYPYHSYSSDTGEHDAGRRLDSSLQMEDTSTSVHRLTPAKFTTAHVKGVLTPRGQMIKILAHYPLDGQPATLELHDQLTCLDDVRKELQDFPGPLVRSSHKNNVLRYCKQKIKDADSNPNLFDKDSYKLIWELLILMIRQNGTIVGTDIAELLMSNRKAHTSVYQPSPSPASSHHSINEATGSQQVGTNQSRLSEEEVTNQFRDYLIYGNTKEALEWAMKHGLWGHALFLASKMDQRTYASVMTRFANGLTMNDPLQTLYQLMSGRQPAAVTCCVDERWGDWRPHLAMILSNTTSRPEIDMKAITTLGDTLGSRGSLHAAHFCYLMSRVEFGTYAHKSSRIVLIGSSHNQPFKKFSTNEAIFATEIFEFACTLADRDFFMPHLQVYKLLIAKRLTEAGILQEAVHYVEVIANNIAKSPDRFTPNFIQEVYDLGDMLKYFDPVYSNSEDVDSNNDPEWLVHLLNILGDYQRGVITHAGSISNVTNYSENGDIQNLPLDPSMTDSTDANTWHYNQQSQPYVQQPQQQQQQQQQEQQLRQQESHMMYGSYEQQYPNAPDYGGNGFSTMPNEDYSTGEHPGVMASPSEDNNQQPWGGQNHQNHWVPHQSPQEPNLPTSSGGEYSGTTPETQEPNKRPSFTYDSFRNEGMQHPQITLPGSVTLPNSKPRTMSQSSEDKKSMQPQKPKSAKNEPGKPNQAGSSWFGGLFSKILQPKNQMILPDDKNPTIVWDPEKKKWVNKDDDGGESSSAPSAPPKASELPPAAAFSNPAPPSFNANNTREREQPEVAPAPNVPLPGPNRYKMPRGKSLRSNYVDIMNPGATAKPSNPPMPTPESFPNFGYTAQPPTNYFIPAPVEGNENASVDFLTPSPAPVLSAHDSSDQSQPQQALSRWSSTSSLSREVQKYTLNRNRTHKAEDYQISRNPQWNGINVAPVLNRLPANQSAANSTLPRTNRYPK